MRLHSTSNHHAEPLAPVNDAGIELNSNSRKIVIPHDNRASFANRCMEMLKMMVEKDGLKEPEDI